MRMKQSNKNFHLENTLESKKRIQTKTNRESLDQQRINGLFDYFFTSFISKNHQRSKLANDVYAVFYSTIARFFAVHLQEFLFLPNSRRFHHM